MTKTNQNYYLGLDIGTNSIGWAVTNEKYNILRAKGSDAWGVRLFEEAVSAEERRTFRSNRRRYQRKRQRLDLLREIFEDEINLKDKNFFLKLDESKYYFEDKKIDTKYNLFNDKFFKDKDYHKKYPTIFHLRYALMNSEKPLDVRLYFLAINHILKRRGHFLFEGQKIANITDINPYIEKLTEIFDNAELDEEISEDFYIHLINILLDKNSNKNDKTKYYSALLKSEKLNKNKTFKEIGNLLIKGKVKLEKLFDDESLQDIEEQEVNFNDESYEDKIPVFKEILDDRFNLIDNLKAIYDYVILQDLLNGQKYISEAQIARFQKHGDDLDKLKILVKRYDNEKLNLYNKVFKSSKVSNNYVSYIGYTIKNGKKIKVKKCTSEDFSKFITKLLKDICEEDADYLEIIEDIKNDNFMPKQITNINSFIPYQLHYMELEKILENLERDYPSFNIVEDGVSKINKIKLLFKFRIPYYVGPLNSFHNISNGGNAWLVKNEEFLSTKIRPWNFEQIVDLKESEKQFIRSMTNYCTYLRDKEVIAKNSLLYSRYMVLNELNNLRINDNKLDFGLKDKIIEDLFKKYKKVTLDRVKNYLIKNNYADEDVIFKGIDQDFKSNLGSYIDFSSILKEKFDEDKVEEIIEYISIHTGNRKIIRQRVNQLFPNLSEKQKNRISSLKYTGWGRFSKEFLVSFKGIEKESKKEDTLINFLYRNNDNLGELLSQRYTFTQSLMEYNKKFVARKISYELLDGLHISPSVKKMTWQSIKIIEEIKKVFGNAPKRIFVEMARGNNEKKEIKYSRKHNLLELYRSLRTDRDFISEIESKTEAEFRSERLFLYYTQMGRCMYSGEEILLENLFDKNTYDIDHIIPRSLKKDDSIIYNKVLVKKDLNQRVKGRFYPVPESIRNNEKIKQLWLFLKDKKFIEEEKYKRLIRNVPLTDLELAGFINRQLVETRQATKAVSDFLREIYTDSKLIYVKAGLVSDFRRDYGILKSREANNLHHAHDAYLNILVGNTYYERFTSNPLNFIKEMRGKYSLNNIFRWDIKNFNGEYIWKKDRDLSKIKDTIEKNSIKVTRENYQGRGLLFDATHVSKDKIKDNQIYLPIKGDDRLKDIKKYGAYGSVKNSYFIIVEHIIKKNKILTIESIPKYLLEVIEREGDKAVLDYCINTLGLISPKIIIPRVLMKTHIVVDGFNYTLNGKTGNQRSVQPIEEPYWTIEETKLIKYVINLSVKSEEIGIDITKIEDRDKVIKLIELIQNKLKKKPFNKRRNTPKEIISFDAKNSNLDILDLAKLAKEFLKVVTPVLETVNLLTIGGKGKVGKTNIPRDISQFEEFKIIDESPAGFYKEEKDVLRLWDGDK